MRTQIRPQKLLVAMTSLSNPDIVTKYEKMVRAVVAKLLLRYHLYNYCLDRDDLHQLGWIALLKSLKLFDPSYGVKFETYASRSIYYYIKEQLTRKQHSAMKLTVEDPECLRHS
jgi:RNA polymerase sigma factor (sigma-70 family)